MKKIYAGIIILLLPLSAFGFRDVGFLIWENDTIRIISNPLWERTDSRLLNEKIVEKIKKAIYPEELLWDFNAYHAEWILLNDSLFLNSINPHNDVEINLNDIFPDIGKNQKLFASWVNGELHSPQGKTLISGSVIHNSLLEQEIVFTIENGLLKKYELFHNRVISLSNLFDDFGFINFVYRNINWEILPDLTNRQFIIYLSVQPNEQGKLEYIIEESISIVGHFGAEMPENDIFVPEIIRVIKLVPEWDVIYQRGRIQEVWLSITLDKRLKERVLRE